MEGVYVRRATLEDKHAVIEINDNVYDGMDYLCDLYEEEFINSSNTKSYVAIFENEIVGFAAVTLVDEGQTVVSRAGRIKKPFINKGFYKLLNNHATGHSSAKFETFTMENSNPAISKSSFQQKYRLISTRPYLRYDLQPLDIRLLSAIQVSSVKPSLLTQSQLHEFFQLEEYRKHIFPRDRMTVYWVPYSLLEANIPLLWTRSEHCHRITDARKENDNVRGLVSISTTVISVNGSLMCNLDVYGTDIVSLKGHLVAHLEFLSKRNTSAIILLISTDVELDYEKVGQICDEFGLIRTIGDSFDPFARNTFEEVYEKNL